MKDILKQAKKLSKEINNLKTTDDKIDILNQIRYELHKVSPLKHHPVDCVFWEKAADVQANEYNPNAVAPPEQELLETSIIEDGYTMPIVTYKEWHDESSDEVKIKIVDGFHRRLSHQNNKLISDSTLGYIPITDIRQSQTETGDRMASTIRHNRARGSHNIELMSTIVTELVEMGKGDPWICKHVGMSADELLRMKQITGLASLFLNKDFSDSWVAESEQPALSIDNV